MSTQSVLKNLQRLASDVPQLVGAAMFVEAEIEMTEAKKLTPVDLGNLRDTGHVQPPEYSGNEISVTMGFGGPAAPYALVQHERLDYFHEVGQAKFLEQPLMEAAPFLAARIAKRVNLAKAVSS